MKVHKISQTLNNLLIHDRTAAGFQQNSPKPAPKSHPVEKVINVLCSIPDFDDHFLVVLVSVDMIPGPKT